jgi:hypothetical protein
MEVIYQWCSGLDVHKRSVVACLITPGPDGTPKKEVHTFGTMTEDLLALSDWLTGQAAPMSPWKALECTGSPSTICWKATLPSC